LAGCNVLVVGRTKNHPTLEIWQTHVFPKIQSVSIPKFMNDNVPYHLLLSARKDCKKSLGLAYFRRCIFLGGSCAPAALFFLKPIFRWNGCTPGKRMLATWARKFVGIGSCGLCWNIAARGFHQRCSGLAFPVLWETLRLRSRLWSMPTQSLTLNDYNGEETERESRCPVPGRPLIITAPRRRLRTLNPFMGNLASLIVRGPRTIRGWEKVGKSAFAGAIPVRRW
jgi:hypothetical protein